MNRTIEDLIRENVKRIKPYASARDDFQGDSSGKVFLDANENPFDSGLNRYPDPRQRLLKSRLTELKGIPESQIILGNGSDEILDLIVRVFCEPYKDGIITLPPTYGMYQVIANTNAVDITEVPLTSDFQPDVEKIIDASGENTKLLFLCSPNNPSSNSLDIVKVEKLINRFSGMVVIDEAYIDFAESESWTRRLNEFPNLIITQTLSKAYGLAGIRLGIGYASELVIEAMNKIKPPYNVNALTQGSALEALHDQNKVKLEIAQILNERTRLTEELSKLSIVDRVFPSDANFILVRVDDADRRYDELIHKNIVVRNRSKLPLCENCLRFTIGTRIENNSLLQALKELE